MELRPEDRDSMDQERELSNGQNVVFVNTALILKAMQGVQKAQADFQDLLDRESPSVFFSQDLCARYFTYARDGETHFVLFDDADTLSQKLRTGGNMGFAAAFLMYPEVQDLLPKLFPGRRT